MATRILVFDLEFFIGELCAPSTGTTLRLIDCSHDTALGNRSAGERKGGSVSDCHGATFQINDCQPLSKRAIFTTSFFNPTVQNADHTMRPASNRLIMSNEDDSPAFSM